MASTYSSRLRIELIGTGEQSGIWGDTTNTNLGTLIDEAIAGVAAITMSDADYTLTVADGATDQSRKAVLVMAGTLSAARNVICPSSQKVYVVKNATTGGFAITIKTSGGTGVSVPNGTTALVYCDGTNVELAANAQDTTDPTFTGNISLDGSVVVNESGADKDFRVEGDTDANLLFTDASADAVGIGTNAPGAKLNVVANTSGDALRITQTGSGNALVVEDSANPDSSPVVVSADGAVVVGGTARFTTATTASSVVQTNGSETIGRFVNDANSNRLEFVKSRSTTFGDPSIIVSNGDVLGDVNFQGADGSAFIRAASINAAVDGTPGTNDMPGRLVFGTTADGASSPSERMRIDSAGNVGIGATAAVGTTLRLGKNITGAVTSHALRSDGVIQSDVTTEYRGFYSAPTTAAASFTLGTVNNFLAVGTTLGSGSTVTNQYGFAAASSITTSANNYGFWSNIAAGTSRTITTVYRTSNVVTITTSVAHGYTAGQSVTVAATTNTGVNGTFTIASTPTTSTFTYAQVGADIPSGADTGITVVVGRWNFYANGSAPNFFAGNVTLGGTETYAVGSFGSPRFQVTGTGGSGTTSSFIGWGTGPSLVLSRSNGASVGTRGIVASGNTISAINFYGDDGASFIQAAAISAAVDGTPGTNDMPGRLVFSTTADGASTPTERVRIDSSGNVGIGTSSPGYKLQVAGGTSAQFRASGDNLSFNGYVADTSSSYLRVGNTTGTTDFVQGNGFAAINVNQSQPLIINTNLTEKLRIDTSGNVGIGTNAPASKLDISGNVAQNVVAVAASAIDCSAGNYFTKTASGALTWTFTNVPASRSFSVLLELTNGGTGTQTWPASMKWPGGTAPTLTASGVDVLGFITDDGGTTWRGVQLMKDSK